MQHYIVPRQYSTNQCKTPKLYGYQSPFQQYAPKRGQSLAKQNQHDYYCIQWIVNTGNVKTVAATSKIKGGGGKNITKTGLMKTDVLMSAGIPLQSSVQVLYRSIGSRFNLRERKRVI